VEAVSVRPQPGGFHHIQIPAPQAWRPGHLHQWTVGWLSFRPAFGGNYRSHRWVLLGQPLSRCGSGYAGERVKGLLRGGQSPLRLSSVGR